MTALVSADDYVSVVRVHADRIHDLLRRLGLRPGPGRRGDRVLRPRAARRARQPARDRRRHRRLVVRPGPGAGEQARRPSRRPGRAGRRGEHAGRDAGRGAGAGRARRDARARADRGRPARRLRPRPAVRRRRPAPRPRRAAALVTRGRLRLVTSYDETPPPTLEGHVGRPAPDLGRLSALSDGTLPAPDAALLRRHVHGCTECGDVVDALARARRLAAGLPVTALPDEDRERLLATATDRAAATLPTLEEVLLAASEDDDDERPLVSPPRGHRGPRARRRARRRRRGRHPRDAQHRLGRPARPDADRVAHARLPDLVADHQPDADPVPHRHRGRRRPPPHPAAPPRAPRRPRRRPPRSPPVTLDAGIALDPASGPNGTPVHGDAAPAGAPAARWCWSYIGRAAAPTGSTSRVGRRRRRVHRQLTARPDRLPGEHTVEPATSSSALGDVRRHDLTRGSGRPRSAAWSISATRNASSIAWLVLSRGSHAVS